MPLERLLLVNKPIAENSETLVDPQSQKSLPRILIVLMAAQQPLKDLSGIDTNFCIRYPIYFCMIIVDYSIFNLNMIFTFEISRKLNK